MAARESRVRMRDKTDAGNVFTVLRGVSEMRARDITDLYDALNPCRAGLLIRYLFGHSRPRARYNFIIVAQNLESERDKQIDR